MFVVGNLLLSCHRIGTIGYVAEPSSDRTLHFQFFRDALQRSPVREIPVCQIAREVVQTVDHDDEQAIAISWRRLMALFECNDIAGTVRGELCISCRPFPHSLQKTI